MGEVRFRFEGAGRVAVQLFDVAGSVGPEARQAVRESGEESVFIFRTKAQRRTGRLHRGIRSRMGGDTATVSATARSARGFDYVAVTRFGHRVRVIRPVHAKALRFRVGNRILFRHSVRGYRPHGDWRDKAMPAVDRTARSALDRAGARIIARVG